MKKQFLASLALSLATISSAYAGGLTTTATQSAGQSVYTYNAPSGAGAPGGALGSEYQNLNLTYNPALNNLRITTSFTSNKVDGYWLAISPGANPKGNSTELAILYMDLKENRYAVYNYNGVNGSNSFSTAGAVFIQGGSAGLTQNGNSYSFNLNVANINNGALNQNAGWTGMEFGSKVGVWYHFFDGDVNFNANGRVTALNAYSQGWSDIANASSTTSCTNGGSGTNGCCPTGTKPGSSGGAGSCCPTGGSSGSGSGCGGSSTSTSTSTSSGKVPLPGSVLLIGLGLGLLGLFGRKLKV